MENKVVYLVRVGAGSYEDYYELEKFVTFDKSIADIWVKKYNRLVNSYQTFLVTKKDILGYIENETWGDRHSEIVYDNPVASYIEVEVRV